MKKIMFNDKYGLTNAVLSGRKTMTRRVIKCCDELRTMHFSHFNADGEAVMVNSIGVATLVPSYAVGEVVAVAQKYRDFAEPSDLRRAQHTQAGVKNKMFVKAKLMPHHIRITNIRVERLQDISDDDCLAEGIRASDHFENMKYSFNVRDRVENIIRYSTPREAYAALIDKVSGKGTWYINPFVFVYDFELVD